MSLPPDTRGLSLLARLTAPAAAESRPAECENETVSLFDEMRERILRYCLGFGLGVSDAEEVVQDTFLALHQHLARGKSRSGLRAWLFQVAHNLSLKRRIAIARMPAEPPLDDAEPVPVADPRPNPEDQLALQQRHDRLQAIYQALPEVDRQCLYLRAEGLRYREIAQTLGISLGGVANSLARSLARLASVDKR
jgi:RNA polymerase sigma-70 factor (ECF subfamily)